MCTAFNSCFHFNLRRHIKGQDLFDMAPQDRARLGLFLSFQSPVEVPGRGLHSFPFQLNLSWFVGHMPQLTPCICPDGAQVELYSERV
jgi:hypothetical protein